MTSIQRLSGALVAAAFAFTAVSAAPTAAHAADVTALDNWGRMITHFRLDWKPKDKKWKYVPMADLLFMVKGAQSDDVALVQYYLGKKKFGPQLKCPLAIKPLKSDPGYSVAFTNRCKVDIDKLGIQKAGKWTVKVGYRQLGMGKDHPDLATYTFATIAHAEPGGVTGFHMDKDFRMGEAWIHMKQDGNSWNLFSWFKVSRDDKTRIYRNSFKLRCFVNGKTLEMNALTNSRYEYEYNDAKKNPNKPDLTKWQYNYFFPPGSGVQFFKDNPGDYRCVMTRGGEIDREFYFKVADGKPVRPKCQEGDGAVVKTTPSTTLIKTVFKTPQDAKFDKKAMANGAFYGRKGVPAACGL